MSYFDDQFDAWMDNDCQGDPTDMNPDEFWADRIADCESRGHGKIKKETFKGGEKLDVCQSCNVILNKK